MKISKLAIVLLAGCALTLNACGKDDKKAAGDKKETKDNKDAPKPSTDTPKEPAGAKMPSDELLGKVATMFTSLDGAITGEGDCKAKAEAVGKVLEDNKDLITEMKTFEKKAAMEAFAKKHPDVMAKMGGWGQVQTECQDVAAALKPLG